MSRGPRMEVNVISQEERAKAEGESYLRSRLAGFNVHLKTFAKHAHWTEFHCSRRHIVTSREGAFLLHYAGVSWLFDLLISQVRITILSASVSGRKLRTNLHAV